MDTNADAQDLFPHITLVQKYYIIGYSNRYNKSACTTHINNCSNTKPHINVLPCGSSLPSTTDLEPLRDLTGGFCAVAGLGSGSGLRVLSDSIGLPSMLSTA